MERQHEMEKREMCDQIEGLRAQLDQNFNEHQDEVYQLTEENQREVKSILNQKDLQLTNTESNILQVQRDLDQERDQSRRLKDELLRVKQEYGEQVNELNSQIRCHLDTIDRQRRENDNTQTNLSQRYDDQKDRLREDYEQLIRTMRNDNFETKSSMENQLDEARNQIQLLQQEVNRAQIDQDIHIGEYQKEVLEMKEQLKSSKRMTESQIKDN